MSAFLHTLWTSATTAVTFGTVALAFAWHPVRRLLAVLRDHSHHQRRIAELLSTRSPDGMADLVQEIHERRGDGR